MSHNTGASVCLLGRRAIRQMLFPPDGLQDALRELVERTGKIATPEFVAAAENAGFLESYHRAIELLAGLDQDPMEWSGVGPKPEESQA